VYAITGLPIDTLTVALNAGWNLVGSTFHNFALNHISQNPPGSVVSVFMYKPGVGYSQPDTIRPGRGYWMKTTQNCTITFMSTPVPSAAHASFIDVEHLNRADHPPAAPGEEEERVAAPVLPKDYALAQNYPNPFNPSTVIRYALPEASSVRLTVYNMLGQQVATLVNGEVGAGFQSVQWNSTNSAGLALPSGIYMYRLEAKSVSSRQYTEVRKMLLMK
jgi:hypothetical protein